jgi:threonine dehydratase
MAIFSRIMTGVEQSGGPWPIQFADVLAAQSRIRSEAHNLAEGSGAAGLAGLIALRGRLAGKRVGIIVSGGNIDAVTLRRVMNSET